MIKPNWNQCFEAAPTESPYCDVTQSDWSEAYEYAAESIYQAEDRERAPGLDEVVNALERIAELDRDSRYYRD